MVGWARLHVSGKAARRVQLRFGEVLKPNGELYTDNLRTAEATDTFILRGEGKEIFEPHFTFHGFRYVELMGYPGTPTRDAIEGVVFYTSAPFHHEVSHGQSNGEPVMEQHIMGATRQFSERADRLPAA